MGHEERSVGSPQNKSFTFDAANQSTFESPPIAPSSNPYDPRVSNSTQQFTAEELVPQHMVRKAKKVHVPEDAKDAKYWARRLKNNAAAKRSREARHQKENEIRLRALHLEKENVDLRSELLDARHELSQLRDLIRKRGLAMVDNPGDG